MEPINIKLPQIGKETFKGIPGKIKQAINEYRRVYRITKKPSMEEFKMVSKVTAIGTVVIGVMGFIIFMVAQLIT